MKREGAITADYVHGLLKLATHRIIVTNIKKPKKGRRQSAGIERIFNFLARDRLNKEVIIKENVPVKIPAIVRKYAERLHFKVSFSFM